MGRKGLCGVVALGLLAACSGGGGSSAASTTTTSTTTSTTAPTTTTNPEDAVKTAYLAYWTMIDRISRAPDPDDPELPTRTGEPLLSQVRDDFATRKAQGKTTQLPSDPTKNAHTLSDPAVLTTSATLVDCFVDGRIAVASDGSTNPAVVTKKLDVSLILDGSSWKVSDVQQRERSEGISACAVS